MDLNPLREGIGATQWETDKGLVQAAGAKLIDGTTYVPFRWLWNSSADPPPGRTGRMAPLIESTCTLPDASIPETPTQTAARRPLSAVIYNWIPNLDEYIATMEVDFEAQYPDIDLQIISLPDYYGNPSGLFTAKADVWELDEGFLREFIAQDKLQPLAVEEVPNPEDFFPICKDVAFIDGKWWKSHTGHAPISSSTTKTTKIWPRCRLFPNWRR
jgi:hypothetical protein